MANLSIESLLDKGRKNSEQDSQQYFNEDIVGPAVIDLESIKRKKWLTYSKTSGLMQLISLESSILDGECLILEGSQHDLNMLGNQTIVDTANLVSLLQSKVSKNKVILGDYSASEGYAFIRLNA